MGGKSHIETGARGELLLDLDYSGSLGFLRDIGTGQDNLFPLMT